MVRPLSALFLALSLAALGCHAQTPPASGSQLSPDLARRIEVLLRSKVDSLPPDAEIQVQSRTPSEFAGYDKVAVTFTLNGKTSPPASFLLSADNKTLAQLTKLDVPVDPKQTVSPDGRPVRGGPVGAPVLIVGFDDLECPFCAKLHQQLFPAILNRYGNQVHIVYRDFPLPNHPWAMRAAVDVNCLAAQSTTGYWNEVDYIHAHSSEIGEPEKTVAKANDQLDALTRDEGKRQKANATTLDACIAKQDDTTIQASMKLGDTLGVDATPALFINGYKIVGVVSLDFVYKIIDGALIAAGQTPPPAATAAAKPGN